MMWFSAVFLMSAYIEKCKKIEMEKTGNFAQYAVL